MRVTACQDTDRDAAEFRTRRLRHAHRVVTMLNNNRPPALADLAAGFNVNWSPQSPHTKIVSSEQRRATAIYLGDEHTIESVAEIAAKAADHIGQWERTPDGIVEGRHCLAVWYRNGEGQDVLYEPHRYTEYDQSHLDSLVDIARDK